MEPILNRRREDKGYESLMIAISGIKYEINALHSKVDAITVNINGDGSPDKKGWAGVIEDIKHRQDNHLLNVGGIVQWAHTIAIVLMGWFLNHHGVSYDPMPRK